MDIEEFNALIHQVRLAAMTVDHPSIPAIKILLLAVRVCLIDPDVAVELGHLNKVGRQQQDLTS